MHFVVYALITALPSLGFTLASQPVQRQTRTQDTLLFFFFILNIVVPVYYAGQQAFLCMMLSAVYAWVNALKMAIWIFCMPIEERRKRPYFVTLWYWREKRPASVSPVPRQDKPKDAENSQNPQKLRRVAEPVVPRAGISSSVSSSASLSSSHTPSRTPSPSPAIADSRQPSPPPPSVSTETYVKAYLKHMLIFDGLNFVLGWIDNTHTVRVFQHAMGAQLLVEPGASVDMTSVLLSLILCALFSIYLQLQLQVTYDSFLAAYAIVYKVLPWVKMSWVAAAKDYIEKATDMPPFFNSPWEATSLRDYWSNRWHSFYNNAFYRLAYRPLRHLLAHQPGFLRRTIPVFGVFFLSGLMHEYFLYCSSGPLLYFGGRAGGWQMIFFLLQPIGIVVGDMLFKPGWQGRLYAIAWMVLTSHFFVIPYILCNYVHMPRLQFIPVILHIWRSGTIDSALDACLPFRFLGLDCSSH
ncbi:membrane bound O-acyl transferase family-domain-containing protein [Syncephalastrum racemosum]|uniref:Membrane bound O-acyl transferase family-domain-containing protein n=1 Tax=Syncephalastrum racemosum TaxID=13706 RepID=A0A1X2HHH5_SYNRA|nr:membrane bound O-acyl transferase family-domain-containing protein [Syncephalastrum racemosum]